MSLGGFGDGITVGATNEYAIHVINPDASEVTKAAHRDDQFFARLACGHHEIGTRHARSHCDERRRRRHAQDDDQRRRARNRRSGQHRRQHGRTRFRRGTLRVRTGFTDDLSLRTIRFLQGGGTIDTAGLDLTFAKTPLAR
ncbi:MAG: hypothetical protein QM775_18010 [Pirellulales bacterium]